MRLLLFTASLLAPASAFAGTFGPDAANFSTMIRSTVLQGYDNMVPPRSDRSASAKADFGGYYSDAGTDVRMQVRFFKVSEVAAASGRMSLKVWHRLYWTDTRLSWDPADYGGVDTIYYGGGNVGKGESNEVWIPDLQPYNAYTGLMHTLDHGLVRVKSDGAVFYSRPGMIDVMCKFSGLVAFPFDKLKCQLEFGGWILSGGHQGVQLEGDGYQFSPQEATAGSSYTEYTIKDIEVEYADYKYDCCPSEPWPVVLYTITMERSSVFYYTIILVPGVLITLLSFAVFWSETESADPLGYGVTIIVVNLLSNIVLLEMLPVCGELLWVDMFSLTNTCFCCISLFQSSVCIMLETFEGDHIVYTFIAVGCKKLYRLVVKCVADCKPRNKLAVAELETGAPAGEDEDPKKRVLSSGDVIESVAGVLYRQKPGVTDQGAMAEALARKSTTCASRASSWAAAAGAAPGDEPPASAPLDDVERMRKLVFFESLFYRIDANGNQSVERDEAEHMLSFCAMHLDPMQRDEIFTSYDYVADGKRSYHSQQEHARDAREPPRIQRVLSAPLRRRHPRVRATGKLNRMEFCALCMDNLWKTPSELLEKMCDNLLLAMKQKGERNRNYWQSVSMEVERKARIVIPLTYFLALLFLFNIDLSDDYVKDAKATMFAGLSPNLQITPVGVAAISAYCGAVVVGVVSTYAINRGVQKATEAEVAAQVEASREAAHAAIPDAVPIETIRKSVVTPSRPLPPPGSSQHGDSALKA